MISLHSSPWSTLVYTRLHSSSDSSTLVYICLATRLHLFTFVCDSSTFVYTRIHSSSDSSVFLEWIHIFGFPGPDINKKYKIKPSCYLIIKSVRFYFICSFIFNFPVSRNRSSHQRYAVKKAVVKNFSNFTGKHLCQSLFLIKLQA